MSPREHSSPSGSGSGDHAIRKYDPAWLHRAYVLRKALRAALVDVAVSVDHIGSTAVPGLGGRPIIDVQVSVLDVADRARYEPALASLGYQHFAFAELAVTDYLIYVPSDGTNTEHVAVCERGSWQERRHLAFRDYLRAHPAAAAHYELVKRQAAEAAAGSRERYAAGKDGTVKQLEQQALAWFDRERHSTSRQCS